MRRALILLPVLLISFGAASLPAFSGSFTSVSASPRPVALGGTLVVTGRGWPTFTSVELRLGPPNSGSDRLGFVRTTSAGTFRRTFRINPAARPGTYVLLACRNACAFKVSTTVRVVRAVTRSCGSVDIPGGRAYRIRATNTTCGIARSVAGSCMRGRRPSGWSVSRSNRTGRTTLRSRGRVVSFQVIAAGGC